MNKMWLSAVSANIVIYSCFIRPTGLFSTTVLYVVTARLTQFNVYSFIANSGSLDCPGKAFWGSTATNTTSLFVEASQVYLGLHVEVVFMSRCVTLCCVTELPSSSTILSLLSGLYT